MEREEQAADPLAGGLMRGYQCGMVWGTALAAGARAYQLFGTGPQAETHAILAAQRTARSFHAQNQSINCREITGIDLTAPSAGAIARFLLKSAPRGSCFGMAVRCAKASFHDIHTAIPQAESEVPSPPVSCSAMLAQRMGASDLHTVMAAGLAGGIGLSGGACGALGTAIWIAAMKTLKPGDSRMDLKSPDTEALIDGFIKRTDHEFECSRIVGRKFENVEDHARYLRAGGCSQIIVALATPKN